MLFSAVPCAGGHAPAPLGVASPHLRHHASRGRTGRKYWRCVPSSHVRAIAHHTTRMASVRLPLLYMCLPAFPSLLRNVKIFGLFIIIVVLGVKIALFLHIFAAFCISSRFTDIFRRFPLYFLGANIDVLGIALAVFEPRFWRKCAIFGVDWPPFSPFSFSSVFRQINSINILLRFTCKYAIIFTHKFCSKI